jgi:hypothetical protein
LKQNRDNMRSNISQNLSNSFCANQYNQNLMSKGLKYTFVYKLENALFFSVDITDKNCQKKQVNNDETARLMAGQWYGFSGSTERKIGLCPGGIYADFTESGYSGTSYNQYGNETMNWGVNNQQNGQGKWSVQGTTDQGTIFVQYNNGQTAELNYRRYDSNCLRINGNVLCKQSSTCR